MTLRRPHAATLAGPLALGLALAPLLAAAQAPGKLKLGLIKLSFAHNPVQDIYLRRVEGRENKKVGLAVKALADPARGCRL
jgi:branched-chain amino acid transport system substrate-binding protein